MSLGVQGARHTQMLSGASASGTTIGWRCPLSEMSRAFTHLTGRSARRQGREPSAGREREGSNLQGPSADEGPQAVGQRSEQEQGGDLLPCMPSCCRAPLRSCLLSRLQTGSASPPTCFAGIRPASSSAVFEAAVARWARLRARHEFGAVEPPPPPCACLADAARATVHTVSRAFTTWERGVEGAPFRAW